MKLGRHDPPFVLVEASMESSTQILTPVANKLGQLQGANTWAPAHDDAHTRIEVLVRDALRKAPLTSPPSSCVV